MKTVRVWVSMSGAIEVQVPNDFVVPDSGSSDELLDAVEGYIEWDDVPNQLTCEVGDIEDVDEESDE